MLELQAIHDEERRIAREEFTRERELIEAQKGSNSAAKHEELERILEEKNRELEY